MGFRRKTEGSSPSRETMIFVVTLKTPNALEDAIMAAVQTEIADSSLSGFESSQAIESRCQELSELCRTWFSFGETLRIEIDTEHKTATVLKTSR